MNQPVDLGPATFLISAANEYEANMLDSILKAEGIPTLLKHKDIGSYLTITTGMSNFGMDIYVPATLVQRSQEILGQETLPANSKEKQANTGTDLGAKRRQRGGIILAGFLLPLVIWVYLILKNL